MPSGRTGRYGGAKATPQHNERIAKEVPIEPERRNVVPDLERAGRRWYVCLTAPQAELRAAASLRRLKDRGFDLLAYVPCEFEWRRSVRSNLRVPRREYQRPILRQYLFLGAAYGLSDRERDVLRRTDVEGRNVHGLSGILTDHGRPVAMSGTGLAWLKDLGDAERRGATNRTPVGGFEPDAPVRIGSGPFVGFPARFLALGPEGETASVELTLMGGRTVMSLPIEDVHAA